MPWKISKIEIENFKFFKKPFILETKNKNVLLYGENGSGKSSIYWSAYTHFQAYTKIESEAKKYFTADNPQNLRNRFTKPEEHSYIRITFDSETGATSTIEDSDEKYYSADAKAKDFMMRTSMASDFMNYKFLSSLFDFKNSEDNEVFELLEKEALPYFDLDEQLFDVNGNPLSTFNAGDWWKYLYQTAKQKGAIPMNSRQHNHYNQRTSQYKNYQALLKKFNDLLKNKLGMLLARANDILSKTFHIDAEICFVYENAQFNQRCSSRVYDGKLHPPRILLKANMVSPYLVDTTQINHPRSFFNEAKITCMALSIRLAILESHEPVSGAASALFIDDLLISLDMPFRRKVIEVILKYANKYQMFIMTHDRAFYHLVASEIEMLEKKDEWVEYELYAGLNEASHLVEPILITHKSHLEKAKQLLCQAEIPASVNATRQAAEEILKKLLPLNTQLDTSYTGKRDLNGLIQCFNRLKKIVGFPSKLAPHLNDARSLLLNPFSHDDIETPFYKNELKLIIKELEELKKVKEVELVDPSKLYDNEYLVNVKHHLGGKDFQGSIVFLEIYRKYEYESKSYYTWPMINLLSSNNTKIKKVLYYSSKKLYNAICDEMDYDKDSYPTFSSCITDKLTGKPLE